MVGHQIQERGISTDYDRLYKLGIDFSLGVGERNQIPQNGGAAFQPPSRTLFQKPPNQPPPPESVASEKYLLLCVNRSKYAIELYHKNIGDIAYDRQLFASLRK